MAAVLDAPSGRMPEAAPELFGRPRTVVTKRITAFGHYLRLDDLLCHATGGGTSDLMNGL